MCGEYVVYSPHVVRRMKSYIHEHGPWPILTWDHARISAILGAVRNRQGRLLGKMESLGLTLRSEAILTTLTLDIVKTSEIEGEILNMDSVRSSIARHLGIKTSGLVQSDRYTDGVVEMMLDATQKYNESLTKERLFAWHACLFPAGRNGMRRITIGAWRKKASDPMRVVSGSIGRERVHYEAPNAERLHREMKCFLTWFNHQDSCDAVIKAGLAHLWFVTIHPFDDGNGRIARAIADMQLARADGSQQRFYSMSNQIRKERKAYYDILEKTQKGNEHKSGEGQGAKKKGIDVTPWLEWFILCLDRALEATENTLADVLTKAYFWERHRATAFNDRQRLMINKMFDGFKGNLTTSKWAKIAKCSQDTALRDIIELVEKKILVKDTAGGRSTHYILK
jgi:Fic family protein